MEAICVVLAVTVNEREGEPGVNVNDVGRNVNVELPGVRTTVVCVGTIKVTVIRTDGRPTINSWRALPVLMVKVPMR